MEDNQLEKRLNLLKKSYDRMPSTFNPEDVFSKIDEEAIKPKEVHVPQKKGQTKWQKASVWLVSLASVFILGIISATFILENDKEQADKQITDEYIQEIKDSYELERENKRELLKLDEERFNELTFVSMADQTIAYVTDKENIENWRKNNQLEQILDSTYTDAMQYLMLPSEMLEGLKANPLVEDEMGSIEFIADYRHKIQSLISAYNDVFMEYSDVIQDDTSRSAGKISAELIMFRNNKYPEELQNALLAMKNQSLTIATTKDGNLIEGKFNFFSLQNSTDLFQLLHANAYNYLDMMANEPYMYAGDLIYLPEMSISNLITMQSTLMSVERDSNLYPIMESYFVELFFAVVKGTEKYPVFDENGIVNEVYQHEWNYFLYVDEKAPTFAIMQPIIEDFEASNWTTSKSWDALQYDDILAALEYERNLDLTYLMPENGFEDRTENLSDPNFKKDIEELYNRFVNSNYNIEELKNVHPIEIMGLIEYGNKISDPYVLLELVYMDDVGPITDEYKAEYVQNYERRVPILDDVISIGYNQSKMETNAYGLPYGYLDITNKDGETRLGNYIIYSEDQIWRYNPGNFWPSDPTQFNEEKTPIDENFMQRVYELYESFAGTKDQSFLKDAKASEIVGLYFYAGDLGDYDTQYELYYNHSIDETIDREEHLNYVEEYFTGERTKFEDFYQNVSFEASIDEMTDFYYPSGIAILSLPTPENPDEEVVHEFKMKKDFYGWHVMFKPME